MAKERRSSPNSKHGARQDEVVSQVEPQLSQREAQEQRGAEWTKEAEPVFAWPARPGWKSSQASGLGKESAELDTM